MNILVNMWFFRVLLGLFLLVINLFNKRNVRFEVLWKYVTSCSLADILYMLFPLFFIPRNWKQQISIKHWYLSTILHGVTFPPYLTMNNSSACNIDDVFLWFYHISAVSQNFIYVVLWYAVSLLTNTMVKSVYWEQLIWLRNSLHVKPESLCARNGMWQWPQQLKLGLSFHCSTDLHCLKYTAQTKEAWKNNEQYLYNVQNNNIFIESYEFRFYYATVAWH
jgi:hypothetical protein